MNKEVSGVTRSWKGKAAGLISVIFSPFISSLALFVPLSFSLEHGTGRIPVALTVLVLSCSVLPLLTAVLMRRLGSTRDLHINERAERPPFFMACLLYSLIALALLFFLGASRVLMALLLCYAVTLAAGAVRTLYTKVSVHCAGLSGLLVIYFFFYPKWSLLVLGALLLTAWARIVRGRHTPAQCIEGVLIAGGLFGLCLILLRLMKWI